MMLTISFSDRARSQGDFAVLLQDRVGLPAFSCERGRQVARGRCAADPRCLQVARCCGPPPLQRRKTGAPAKGTLRSVRVIVRGMQLEAPLVWLGQPAPQDLQCLALACLAIRHAGLGRNRGRGHTG
jgi:hypothetical protein